jgi:RNA polymerase sigma-70 factor (ECF subfamily)
LSAESKHEFLTAVEQAHGRQLRRFFSARMRNAADVPDLVQEVFLRLLRIDRHEAIRNPQAYLYTVASHVLHQHVLRDSARTEVVRFAEVLRDLRLSDATNPALEVETEQYFEALGRALEQHSPRAYATLVLHRCHGVPLKDISVQLGVSYTMTKRYLAQALAYCQQQLEEQE